LEGPGVDGSIILRWIFRKWDVRAWTVSSWLRIGTDIDVGRESSIGIVTGYRLDVSAIESRWGTRFSAPVQIGPGGHPASCTMGTESFPGVKSGQGVTLAPHSLLVPWS